MHVLGKSNNRNACAFERHFFCSNETARISVDMSRHTATTWSWGNCCNYRKRKLSCNSCFRSCPRDQFLFTMLQLSSTLYRGRWVSYLMFTDCMSFWPLLKVHDYWKACYLSFAEFIPSLLVLSSGVRNIVTPAAHSSKQIPLFINPRYYHTRRKCKGYSFLFLSLSLSFFFFLWNLREYDPPDVCLEAK